MPSISELLTRFLDGLSGACYLKVGPHLSFNLSTLEKGYVRIVGKFADILFDEKILNSEMGQFFDNVELHLSTSEPVGDVIGRGFYNLYVRKADRSHLDVVFGRNKNRIPLRREQLIKAVQEFKARVFREQPAAGPHNTPLRKPD